MNLTEWIVVFELGFAVVFHYDIKVDARDTRKRVEELVGLAMRVKG